MDKTPYSLSIPHVRDPHGDNTPVTIPPHALGLRIKTALPNGWPITFHVNVDERGGLEVRCHGARGRLMLTNLIGNGVTLRVEEEARDG